MEVGPDKIKIDTNKIDSIGVGAVSHEVDQHDLLQPDIEKGKTPFFDGFIWVYKDLKQKNENFSGRIAIQVKARSVDAFKRKKCTFRPIYKVDLEAYKKESGIIFFVVEVLKKNKAKTKIFWKQLLPYELHNLLEKAEAKGKNSVSIDLLPLEGFDLTLLCQKFIEDRDKQKHGNIRTIFEINGIKSFDISTITGLFGRGDSAIDALIRAKNPLYLYAKDVNDTSFPIANIVEDHICLSFQETSPVWVGDKCYGERYFSRQLNETGYYYQFGQSTKFLMDGRMHFSASGFLDERIKDIDFILEVAKGRRIRIGNVNFPYLLDMPIDLEAIKSKMVQTLESLQITKSVFDFLGMQLPVDITSLKDDDFRLLFALSEYINHAKACPVKFKKDGINILGIGKYRFVVIAHPEGIVNFFDTKYTKEAWAIFELVDGTKEKLSLYYFLTSEIIAKSGNFDCDLVMDSVRSFAYTEATGCKYNELLLESIKAIDVDPKNKRAARFARNLADYLIENEDSLIHRLNKIQIKKRFGPLEESEIAWLRTERDKEDEPRNLCGIAILLDDKPLFDEQFIKLSRKAQAEFRKYPIMKLLKVHAASKKR